MLTIEPLAIAIRNNHIHGITRLGTEHKPSSYADDLLLFVSKAETTIPLILELLAKFGEISGYKLNLHKSELLPHYKHYKILQCPLKRLLTVLFIVTRNWVIVTRNFCDLFKK